MPENGDHPLHCPFSPTYNHLSPYRMGVDDLSTDHADPPLAALGCPVLCQNLVLATFFLS